MKFIGLRHGESEFNLLRLCNDDPSTNVDLTDKGRGQALRVVDELRPHSIQRIISSELPRARQTADLIASELRLVVETDRRLNDIRTGCDGLPVDHYLNAIAIDPLNTRIDAGETLLEFHSRINAFLTQLANAAHDVTGVTLLITHEEAMRVFKARAEGLRPADVLGLAFANCRPYFFIVKTDSG